MNIGKNNLSKVMFFNKLDANEISYIYPYIDERKFAKGEVILAQGSKGGDLYVIISGSVSVDIVLPGDHNMQLAILTPGQVFGEVTFLSDSTVTASVVAQQSCKCLILYHKLIEMLHLVNPNIAFKLEQEIAYQTATKISANVNSINNLLKRISEGALIHSEHARNLENIAATSKDLDMNELDFEHLNGLSFFQNLNEKQILSLLSVMNFKSYDKGYRFLEKMKKSRKIGLLYSGDVMLFMKENNQLKKSLAVVKVGDLFLQNFIFSDFCEVADYVACKNIHVLELDMDEFYKLRDSNPAIFYTISRSLNQEIARSVYIVNRQLVRISSEYHHLIAER